MNLIKVDYYDKMINLANLRDAHLGQARPGQAESGLKGLDKAAYVQVSVQVSLLMIIEAGDMSAR